MNRINLNDNWYFSATDYMNGKIYSVNIPTSVQYSLYSKGELPDYNIATNEKLYYELENKKWIFTKTFMLDDISAKLYRLNFDGIDTVAKIFLNGVQIGYTDNMHIAHSFDVNHILKIGENRIEVKFDPILSECDKRMDENKDTTLNFSMDKRRPWIRKMQCAWGWDWGPRILEVGIWKDVYLQVIDDACIDDFYFKLIDLSDAATVNISGEITDLVGRLSAKIHILFKGETVCTELVDISDGKFNKECIICDPKIWYPNGYGEQNLYEVTVEIISNQRTVDRKTIETGIKSIHLIQEDDGEGTSFIFEVNGIRVFAKGACWIPADNFLNRIQYEDYKEYITMVREANMNMIRIWGGGIYENDAFYKECNRQGILVWQDFLYSCAEYPDHNAEFVKSAEIEAIQAVKRLRNNPCLALYCGNNEINWLMQLYYNKKDDYIFGGNRIFKSKLPEICQKLDSNIPYWISSPYSEQGDCNSVLCGDIHSWDVWCFWAEIIQYEQVNGKFISEFGFQSMPDIKTVYEYTPEDQRQIYSDVSFNHNKSYEGLEHQIKYLFTEIGIIKDFESFIFLSQFVQAEAIKIAVEHWRSRKFKTAGTLYWQLNDIWGGASWSAIDYKKRPKALYHYSRRFYDDVLLSVKCDNDELKVIACNDKLYELSGMLKVSVWSFDGKKIFEDSKSITVGMNDIETIYTNPLDNMGLCGEKEDMPTYNYGTVICNDVYSAWKNSIVFVELVTEDKTYVNYKVLLRYRHLNIKEANIQTTILPDRILLQADKPVIGLFLESDTSDCILEDNCITMQPERQYEIKYKGKLNSIRLRDLYSLK